MDLKGLRDLLPGGVDLIFAIRFTEIGIVIEIKTSAVLCRLEIRNLESAGSLIKIVISRIIVEKRTVLDITAISKDYLVTGINTDKLADGIVYADAFFLRINLVAYSRRHVSDTRIDDYVSHIHLKRRTSLRAGGVVGYLSVRLTVIHLHFNADSLGASEGILIRTLKVKNELGKLRFVIVISPGDSITRVKILRKSRRTCGSRLRLASLRGCFG